jgi:hypothetical protein
VGTSTKVPGPRGGNWTSAKRRAARWRPDLTDPAAEVARIGDSYLGALRTTVAEQPDAFGLYGGMSASGGRLVDALERLDRADLDDILAAPDAGRSELRDAFVGSLVDEISGPTGLLIDAVVRRAAVRAVDELLGTPGPSRTAGEHGAAAGGGISGELFCAVYQLFFAELIAEFVTMVIAEQIQLAVPVLPVVDPAGHIAEWIADQIFQLIPSPCEEATQRDHIGDSLADVARDLLAETVSRAIGLPPAEREVA